MKFTRLALILGCLVSGAFAAEPLYSVEIKSVAEFELVSGLNGVDRLSFYANSRPLVKGERTILAAQYATGMRVKTSATVSAGQGILRQIVNQTGLMLAVSVDSTMTAIAPVVMLQGVSEIATITLLLTPVEGEADVYQVSLAYALDERPLGSIDGTTAAKVQLEEQLRQLTGDSNAGTLPERFKTSELKAEDFFRGHQRWEISNQAGTTLTEISVLMLKAGRNFTIGFYRNAGGVWVLMDQPMGVKDVGSPHFRSRMSNKAKLASIRAIAAGGKTGIDFFVEDGHVVQVPFAEGDGQ